MPSINRIRLSNIRYSHGLKYYDDITLNIWGKSFLIEYINGGGKTFLAQCAMQTILPKSHFTAKHPIEELFDHENKNNTIHSLVEWKLDNGSDFEYLVTGFCARKKVSNGEAVGTNLEEKSKVDYFNYAYFYNKNATYTIENIPLKEVDMNDKIRRMNYSELRRFIRELNNNSDNCHAEIFDTKIQYSRVLKDFKINTTEWELLREANFTEGYVPHFLGKYSTSKSFIQDFLIPQIDKANELHNQGDYQNSNDRAESLLDIKEALVEYSKRIEDKKELEKLEVALNDLLSINNDLLSTFNSRETIKENITKCYNRVEKDISDNEEQVNNLDTDIETNKSNINEFNFDIENKENEKNELEENIKDLKGQIRNYELYKKINSIKSDKEVLVSKHQELNNKEVEIKDAEDSIHSLDKKEKLFKAEDKFVSYLKENSHLLESYELKDNYEKSQSEIIEKLKKSAGEYKYLLEKELNNTTNTIVELDSKDTELNNLLSDKQKERDNTLNNITRLKLNLETLNSNIETSKDHKETLLKQTNDLLNSLSIDMSINNDILSLTSSLLESIKSTLNSNTDDNNLVEVKKIVSSNLNKITDIVKNCISTMVQDKNELVEIKNILNLISSDDKKTIDTNFEFSFDISHIESLENKSMDLISEISSSLETIVSSLNLKLTDLKNKANEIDVNLYKKNEDIKSLTSNIDNLNTEINKKKESLNLYNEEVKALSPTLNKYNSTNVYELNTNLLELKFDKTATINKLEKDKVTALADLNKLKSNKGLVLKDSIEQCYKKIKERYPNAILGVDFLSSLSIEDKKIYLDKTESMIAYSILLGSNDFTSINRNSYFISEFKDELVPIMDIDSIKSGNDVNLNNVYLTKRSTDEILDEEKIKKEIDKKHKEIDNLEVTIISENDKLIDINTDLDKISKFIMKYNESYMKDILNNIEDINSNIDNLKSKVETVNSNIEELNNHKSLNNKDINNCEVFINSLEGCIENVSKYFKANISNIFEVIYNSYNEHLTIINSINEFNETTKQRNLDLNNVVAINNNIEKLNIEKNTIDTDIKIIESQKVDLVDKKAELKSIFNEYSKKINSIAYDSITADNLSLNDAEAIYNSARESSYGKIKDIERVNEEISRTKERISLIEKEIFDFGHSVEEFKLMDKTFVLHSVNDYKSLSFERNKFKDLLKTLKHQEDKIKGSISKLEGKIEQIKSDILRDYKVDAETYEVPDIDIEASIQNSKAEISKIKDAISEIDNAISIIKDSITELTDINTQLTSERDSIKDLISALNVSRNDIDNIIESEGIDTSLITECADDINYIKRDANSKISPAQRDLRLNKRKIDSLKEKHSKKIEITKGSLKNSVFNIKNDLDEILPPESLFDTKLQIEAICGDFGYLTLLEEEKSTLESDLIALEESQNAFIELCLQRANYAYDKLKDIEDFSKVDIGGKTQETMRVKLDLLPVDEQVIKMRNYINKIVSDSEKDYGTREEKIKFLSKSLELKNLFPQILSSIDKCKLEMFKINDTCDGGMFLTWGKAGSTGQTNAMYVFSFICIMTYIRKLSSYDVKDDSRQLIFLDNPFSGTVAVNLWKIPIELMKKNNIQFMCLGFETPATLTSMFDVRYSLGGKMMSNNVETVEIVNTEVISKRDGNGNFDILDTDTIE